MHVKELVSRVTGLAVRASGILGRRKRLTLVVVVAALLAGPLATGDGELVFLNAVGLGLGALLLRRCISPGGRPRKGRAQREQRQQATSARQAQRTATVVTQTQYEGGHDDDASNDGWWDWDKAATKPGRAGRPAASGAVQG